jgi:hypothetical protein
MAASRSRWQGHIRTAGLFLLLGAVTTIVLAETFSLFGSLSREPLGEWNAFQGSIPGPPRDLPRTWTILRWEGRGLRIDTASSREETALAHSTASWPHRAANTYNAVVLQAGWPMLALQDRVIVLHTADDSDTITPSRAIALPQRVLDFVSANTARSVFPTQRRLLVQPVWPGFLFNTLLYAMLFWVTLRLRGASRIALRGRRRQCLGCGYPIGDSTLCSECGVPVRA